MTGFQRTIQPVAGRPVQRDQRGITGSAPDIAARQSAGQIQHAQCAGLGPVTAVQIACQIIIGNRDVIDIDRQLAILALPVSLSDQGRKRQRFAHHTRCIDDHCVRIDAQPAACLAANHIPGQTGKAGDVADLVQAEIFEMSLDPVIIRVAGFTLPLRIQVAHFPRGRISIQTCAQIVPHRQVFCQCAEILQTEQIGPNLSA